MGHPHDSRRLDDLGDKSPIDDTIEFSELKTLTDKLDDLYEAVNIRVFAKDIPEDYRQLIFKRPSHEFGKYELKRETDYLLKNFANIGGLWDMPEREPVMLHAYTNEQIQRFDKFRIELGGPKIVVPKDQIEKINQYRRPFGKPD